MTKNKGKWVMISLLAIYLLILADLVFFSAYFGRTDASINRYSTMNLVPFRTVMIYIRGMATVGLGAVLLNILGNILVFMPFGLFLPYLCKKLRRFFIYLLVVAGLSLFIEITQGLFAIGVVDVDDLILNVLGGGLGFLVMRPLWKGAVSRG